MLKVYHADGAMVHLCGKIEFKIRCAQFKSNEQAYEI